MTTKPFHLAWFLNFVADEWYDTWGSGKAKYDGEFYIDMTRSLERAGFDFVLIEDKSSVNDTYGGTMEFDLKHGIVPKHDPAPLATLLAYCTSRIGVVPTLSTSFYPPFLLARLASTIDHISNGRFGWNIVTSGEDRAAQNFGLDHLYEHDRRYEMADEFLRLVMELWHSWDPDAIVLDRATSTFADHRKVRTIDFKGEFYTCRGPLNTAPPIQGHPVLCQAGASPRGRTFAAKFADAIIAVATTPEDMRRYRDDIRERVASNGRNSDDCKILFLVSPIVADTKAEAHAKQQRWMDDPHFAEHVLVYISSITGVDFSQFDLDAPVPQDVDTNGERGTLQYWLKKGQGKTLREHAKSGLTDAIELVGTPAEVADKMQAVMDEAGGDGFLITSPVNRLNRRYVTEIADGLVPELQRRGLCRTEYEHEQFRANLLAF
jgi:FMN-dependent oxidoreductase (nitrilotriacetate monooxygenase family)